MSLTEEDLLPVWEAYWADRSDADALDLLLRAYAHLAGYYARLALVKAPAHQDRDDILSYAQQGLLQAIERYDPSKGAKFETWAQRTIPRRIMDGQRQDDPLSRGMRSKVKLVTSTQEALGVDRMPTPAEVAEELSMTETEVRDILLFQQSMTAELDVESDRHVSDSEGEVVVHMAETRAYVAARLAELGPRQRAFALTYYCDTPEPDKPEKTLVQACRELAISPDWARQTRRQIWESLQR